MRLALIACHVLNRELSYVASTGPNSIKAHWLEQGLHDTPELLRKSIQKKIDEIEAYQQDMIDQYRFERTVETIVLGYGLCSNGVIGLQTHLLPLVVPRCDDCISLFLGSRQRYLEEFHARNGIFWYNPGWIETCLTPSKVSYEKRLERYNALYGEDNGEYLMEMENGWTGKYENCVYIESPIYPEPAYEDYTKEAAAHFGWQYTKLQGQMGYIESLLSGQWDDERFLVCPPGREVGAEYTGRLMEVK